HRPLKEGVRFVRRSEVFAFLNRANGLLDLLRYEVIQVNVALALLAALLNALGFVAEEVEGADGILRHRFGDFLVRIAKLAPDGGNFLMKFLVDALELAYLLGLDAEF